jgi:prepilin-type N-terminal cleavage/methylation domain-containing protein
MIHKLRARAENESGFTLIELLIVIIILGILATIVLFATGTFTSDSTAAACKANARIANIAEAAYAAKNDGTGSNGSQTALEPYLENNTWFAKNGPTYGAGKWNPC